MAVSIKTLQEDRYLGWLFRYKPNWKWVNDHLEYAVVTGIVVAMGYYLLMQQLSSHDRGTPISDPLAWTLILAMMPGFLMLERLTDWRLSVVVELEIGIAVLIGSYVGIFQAVDHQINLLGLSQTLAQFVAMMLILNAVVLGMSSLLNFVVQKLINRVDDIYMRRFEKRIAARGISFDEFTSMFEVSEAIMPRSSWGEKYYVVSDAQTGDWLRTAFGKSGAWNKAEEELIRRIAPLEYETNRRRELMQAWAVVIGSIGFVVALVWFFVQVFS